MPSFHRYWSVCRKKAVSVESNVSRKQKVNVEIIYYLFRKNLIYLLAILQYGKELKVVVALHIAVIVFILFFPFLFLFFFFCIITKRVGNLMSLVVMSYVFSCWIAVVSQCPDYLDLVRYRNCCAGQIPASVVSAMAVRGQIMCNVRKAIFDNCSPSSSITIRRADGAGWSFFAPSLYRCSHTDCRSVPVFLWASAFAGSESTSCI